MKRKLKVEKKGGFPCAKKGGGDVSARELKTFTFSRRRRRERNSDNGGNQLVEKREVGMNFTTSEVKKERVQRIAAFTTN